MTRSITTNIMAFSMISESIDDSIYNLLKTNVPLLLLVVILANLLYNRFRPGLRHIPGPELAKYTRLWRLYNVFKGNAHITAIGLHRKHGSLVRIGPNHVSVGDPKEIQKIYGLKTGFTKVRWIRFRSVLFKEQTANFRHRRLFTPFRASQWTRSRK